MYELALFPLLKATWETIYMVFISSAVSISLGLLLGCALFVTAKKTAFSNRLLYRMLSLLVNIVRSLPFIILMILIIPLTRFIMGTSIGTNAAILPLAIAAIPFYARICENALAAVPQGLVEAANAMGATTWQMINKVLLPESLPALIRGGTLTIIGLIGYSAMAGVVGGGGLGELAINYGYQRFDIVVMLETVTLLVVLVQVIQMLGDRLADQRRIKPILWVSLVLGLFCLAYQVWPSTIKKDNTLRVGVISGWSEDVMKVAEQVAKDQYGLNLMIIPFSDYIQPNTALSHGNIDANIFQHLPYLQAQMKAYHYDLSPIAKTFVYPMGFYSSKITQISQLKDGALVAIPNDPSNGSRALLLLEKYNLIKLKPEAGVLSTLKDIILNPYHLQFKLLDAAQLPRSLQDADLVAVTNDFLTGSGLAIQQALLKEGSDSLYANLIVVRTANTHNPLYQELIAVMHSAPVVEKTEALFPKGAAIPAW